MCFTLQRYKFSSKSQRPPEKGQHGTRCVLPCKGTNFQANHNVGEINLQKMSDVFYLAKVQIFKQITTPVTPHIYAEGMCFTLQRYKFSSKSQLCGDGEFRAVRCVLPCKGTNFQANHNWLSQCRKSLVMCFTLQRYKFSSKSQHQNRTIT